jgi:hypothetical protein
MYTGKGPSDLEAQGGRPGGPLPRAGPGCSATLQQSSYLIQMIITVDAPPEFFNFLVYLYSTSNNS